MRSIYIFCILFLLLKGICYQADAQWSELTNSPGGEVSLIGKDNKLFALVIGGLFVSTDDGSSWTQVAGNNFPMGFSNMIYNANGILYVSDETEGIYHSADDGLNWIPDTTGLPKDPFNQSQFNHFNTIFSAGGYLYANSTQISEVYIRLLDGTDTWQKLNVFSNGSNLKQVITKDNSVYAVYNNGTENGLYVSTDQGYVWMQIPNTGNAITAGAIANGIAFTGTALVMSTTDGLYLSEDVGNNWNRIDNGFPVSGAGKTVIGAVFADSKHIFVSSAVQNKCYLSSDNGVTWEDISDGLSYPIMKLTAINTDLYGYSSSGTHIVKYAGIVDTVQQTTYEEDIQVVNKFSIYPNPVQKNTTISFDLNQSSLLQINIDNVLGQRIDQLFEGVAVQGKCIFSIDLTKIEKAGVYSVSVFSNEKLLINEKIILGQY